MSLSENITPWTCLFECSIPSWQWSLRKHFRMDDEWWNKRHHFHHWGLWRLKDSGHSQFTLSASCLWFKTWTPGCDSTPACQYASLIGWWWTLIPLQPRSQINPYACCLGQGALSLQQKCHWNSPILFLMLLTLGCWKIIFKSVLLSLKLCIKA